MAVGASDKGDNYASYSNYGQCVAITAPGSSILSTYIGQPNSYAIELRLTHLLIHTVTLQAQPLRPLTFRAPPWPHLMLLGPLLSTSLSRPRLSHLVKSPLSSSTTQQQVQCTTISYVFDV